MADPNPSIFARNGRFYDADGRQVILHGINYVNKDPQQGYIFPEDESAFAAFRAWGFNCVRLGVIWDGLEPQPGEYNEIYLQRIQNQLDCAHANNLYVFLDMHQDLYSVLYSDGAPAWATLTDGHPHQIEGSVWDDAYYTSPALQTALDHFWHNTPAPSGIGLQDHFAACWKMLAQRFGSHPAVIGYDLMNEPMPGTVSPEILMALLGQGAELLAAMKGLDASSIPGMAEQFLQPEGRLELFQHLNDGELFAALLEAPTSLCQAFERQYLMPFYRRVAEAIRSVDTRRILFLETSGFSNFGVSTAIEPLNGDGQQAYAPHSYDLVTDTAEVAYPGPARLELIYSRHAETSHKGAWPALVGEWGAYGFHENTLPAAWLNVRQLEQRLFSDTYWAYETGIERSPIFPALSRPYPERVAGTLESYAYDPAAGCFTCAWQEDAAVSFPTIIYLPDWFDFDPANLTLTPSGQYRVETSPSGGTWLLIRPIGAFRRITIHSAIKNQHS
jgi:endoglycosylceramidase